MSWTKIKSRTGNILETIWDGGDTLWDMPEPRTFWDKDLNIGIIPQNPADTTFTQGGAEDATFISGGAGSSTFVQGGAESSTFVSSGAVS